MRLLLPSTRSAAAMAALCLLTFSGCGTQPPTPEESPAPAAEPTASSAPDEDLQVADSSIDAPPEVPADEPAPDSTTETAGSATDPVAIEPAGDLGAFGASAEPEEAPEDTMPAEDTAPEPAESQDTPGSADATAETTPSPTASGPSLDEQLAALVIPPPWMESVTTSYDTSLPWKDARLEIRRLFSLGKPETHREAMKLMWIYHTKDDMGDHHEYPMYTFMGGELVWSIKAHQEYLAMPHENPPFHAYMPLASLYAQFGEFERAKAVLDQAGTQFPDPPWRIMRQADLMRAYGNLYAAWGKAEEAKQSYAEAARLYPTAKPPYGGHTLPRRAADCQAKLDLLTFQSLASATLRDGDYRDRALGYAGDINLTVKVSGGRIADIQISHQEKIDQGACVTIPERIISQQSLLVDGISGATVTKDAIVTGVYRCLKKAGLK